MHRRAFCASGFVLALAGCGGVRLVEPALAGRWTPTYAELGGKALPISDFHGAVLDLGSTTYEFGVDAGTYAVIQQTTPHRMDIHGLRGPNTGRTIPAIYALSGNNLAICYQLGAGERPADFVTPAGSQILLVRYRRGP